MLGFKSLILSGFWFCWSASNSWQTTLVIRKEDAKLKRKKRCTDWIGIKWSTWHSEVEYIFKKAPRSIKMDTHSIWMCGMIGVSTVTNPWHAAHTQEGTPSQCAGRATSKGRPASTGVWHCAQVQNESHSFKMKAMQRYQKKSFLPKLKVPNFSEGYHDLKGRQCNIAVSYYKVLPAASSCQSDFRLEERKRQQEEVLVDQVDIGLRNRRISGNRSFVLPIVNRSSFF